MSTPKVGDCVRFVQTDSCGTVVEVGLTSPADGGPRVSVRWDGSGKINQWDPGFLRSAKSLSSRDPDEVVCGKVGRRRGSVKIVPGGVTLVVPEGLFRLPD